MTPTKWLKPAVSVVGLLLGIVTMAEIVEEVERRTGWEPAASKYVICAKDSHIRWGGGAVQDTDFMIPAQYQLDYSDAGGFGDPKWRAEDDCCVAVRPCKKKGNVMRCEKLTDTCLCDKETCVVNQLVEDM